MFINFDRNAYIEQFGSSSMVAANQQNSFQGQLDQAQVNLQAAKTALDNAKNAVTSAQQAVDKAQAALNGKLKQFIKHQEELKR